MESGQLVRTTDPGEAAEILAGLQAKKEAGLLCLFPGCLNERQPATGKSGRRRGYCALEEHNIATAYQERQRLKTLVEGATQESAPPVGKSSPPTLRDSVISHMLRLLEEMPQYLALLREIGDPDLVLSQLEAAASQATIQVAEAEGRVTAERSLRLASERAREQAVGEAREAQETTAAALQAMEEAEERARVQAREDEQRMAEIQRETTLAISQVQEEARLQIEAIQTQAAEAIDQAQAATSEALERASRAEIRANTAEIEARVQITAAERLVGEVNATLERERTTASAQLAQLRGELAAARELLEEERSEFRAEMGRLRQDLTEAGRRAEAERREVERLRQELAEERSRTQEANRRAGQATERADQLARVADELRDKMLQIQGKGNEEPGQP